jgi:hypothetical protein
VSFLRRKAARKLGAAPSSQSFSIGDKVVVSESGAVGILKDVSVKAGEFTVKLAMLESDDILTLKASQIEAAPED